MKPAFILTILTLLTPTLSTITIEKDPDGIGFKAISIPDGVDVKNVKRHTPAACNRDNCFRAMTSRISTASSFCTSFTTTTVTATTGLGPWEKQCDGNPGRVSSACSCLVPPPPKPTCGGLGTHCTLSTFITDCCESLGCCRLEDEESSDVAICNYFIGNKILKYIYR
ncbi:uncharacterized protein DFL_006470 [Arthrobotrys flagrans]|uniref:Hydrophobin n=1 Tax=Arthrobotrys flagrans TaxID=97331 RepID=A0A437A0I8_ARTFL|nr:hypothetical protein DFL_006470 [Arthrobotrys flagrans]